ncbi:lactonase family protein [Pleomorphovibrio marinus]|uniref:lactonase family protein n=1 Tax=Pleomorphovibrio marinus TaxID=2164132 RepID=UPI000E09EC4B|nr:lactonase family protein [Pleomorphovibrio marinus]
MKKNLLLSTLASLAFACGGPTENKEETQVTTMEEKSYQFLLGSYTDEPSQGIYLVEFSPSSSAFNVLATASEPENPSFLTVNENQDRVYNVEETGGPDGGKVSSFKLEDGRFEKINTVSAKGNGPCYVAMDPKGNFVVAGNYSAGSFAVLPIGEDGKLEEAVHAVKHEGSSANPNRQKQPHVHSVLFHPSEDKMLIADLGTDEVVVYDFDGAKEKPLNEKASFRLKVEPGAGPRHMVFNDDGDRLYLVHEITAEIGVYSYEDGKLSHLETHSLLREGFDGKVGAAEVRLSPDGKFLYVSNRGEANEIIAYKIQDEGKLSHVQTISSGGEAPRNFNITPDGKYMLVGHQGSNTLLAFERNEETGELSPMDISLNINKPVYIKFL